MSVAVSATDALEQFRERLTLARHNGVAVRLRGAGTKDFYGERLEGEVLELRPHWGIVDYEPSELVITARCGTPLSQIEQTLAERGQFLPFEPPAYGGDPTIGGIVACGLSGPRRLQVGAVRDFVLGAKLLRADGEELTFGGRVMKNVAGFDVSRVLCGSLGILGIISEVSLKVLPRPRCELTVRLTASAREAIDTFNRLAGLPLPLSGAAWSDGMAWLRLSGAAAAVRAGCARIGGETVEPAPAADFWDDLRHGTHALFASDSLWRVSVPQTAPPLELPGTPLIDWGGALRWYAGDISASQVRAAASRYGGTALRWKGESESSRFHPLSPAVSEIHRRLKRHFDPGGLINRGRLIAGL
jgi:glycolate oxidase FAD binding subunit